MRFAHTQYDKIFLKSAWKKYIATIVRARLTKQLVQSECSLRSVVWARYEIVTAGTTYSALTSN